MADEDAAEALEATPAAALDEEAPQAPPVAMPPANGDPPAPAEGPSAAPAVAPPDGAGEGERRGSSTSEEELAELRKRAMRLAAKAAVATSAPAAEPAAMPVPVAAPSVPAKDPPKWKGLSMGFALSSKMNALSVKPTAELATSLQEASTRFMTSFHEFIEETLAACQTEVLAAKVPLASYGRVKSALDAVKDTLTTTAEKKLTEEFAMLRENALESMKNQKVLLEEGFHNSVNETVATIKANASEQVAEVEAKLKEANEEVARLRERSNKPEFFISNLETALTASQSALVALELRRTSWRTGRRACSPAVPVSVPPQP